MINDHHGITIARRTRLNQARVSAANRNPVLARLGLLALGLVSPLPHPAAEKPPEQERNQSQVFCQVQMERALRYPPDRGDFVITNGAGSFNRPLYAAIWASDDLQCHGGGATHARPAITGSRSWPRVWRE